MQDFDDGKGTWPRSLLDAVKRADKMPTLKRVVLIWVVRNVSTANAFTRELEMVADANAHAMAHSGILEQGMTAHGSRKYDVRIYVTNTQNPTDTVAARDLEANLGARAPSTNGGGAGNGKVIAKVGAQLQGRPNFEEIFAQVQKDESGHGSVGVFSCGPTAMMNDVQRAVAKANGRSRGSLPDFHLHEETYEW